MGEKTEDEIEEEEFWEEEQLLHSLGQCEYDCPFCESERFYEESTRDL